MVSARHQQHTIITISSAAGAAERLEFYGRSMYSAEDKETYFPWDLVGKEEQKKKEKKETERKEKCYNNNNSNKKKSLLFSVHTPMYTPNRAVYSYRCIDV